ncbi:hypothetical protein PDIG_11380 [Penicillium digitatum PHI26]|uniref:Uncharacterized protein n=2 Tax=Penicillium digitatum TaxID=36651 RepID=K9G8D6_PEND2|nr:hypothetical protein PDIP_82880 [Penicillium digitatum Pd1]EKV05503.1 hypothetical protein PDIP_82880 [Penicillium digitatum Pd1]EKV18190.1 hypothetical protein PDIG_11380 [Penicillium digitatum PHI26]
MGWGHSPQLIYVVLRGSPYFIYTTSSKPTFNQNSSLDN